jgi:NADPH2:quinone reductase
MRAVRVSRTGGPEVLEPSEVPDPQPGDGELLVAVEAAGVNFIDVYRRSGLYSVPLPSIPGSELAGTVLAAGPGVEGFAPGDRVASSDASGAYAERAIVPAARAVPVPDGVTFEQAAAVLLQGLTAHYLVNDTFPLHRGQRCVVHAAAGGVGLLLVQLARRIGAEVFATVGSAAKADAARSAGADHVIVTADQDFAAEIEAIAGPHAVDVVYDGVGRDTFDRGLDVLRPRGMMVTFGNASGPVDPVSPLVLMNKGSLFLTRPTLGHYVATTAELCERAAAVFDLVVGGDLSVHIGTRLPLDQAAEAHRLLEVRRTSGKVLLLPPQ